MLKLPDWKDPIIFTLLVVAGIVAMAAGIQTWRLHGARVDLAESRQELAEVKADRSAVLVQRDQALAANGALQRSLQAQSQAVAALKAAADEHETKALAAARATLRKPFTPPASNGHLAMNAWLREQFGSP